MRIKKFLATGGLTAVLVGAVAGVAVAATIHPASTAWPAAAVHHVGTTGTSQGEESEPSGEAASPETDGPGGHQDVSGQNVDHQFDGVE
jgi:hypothetical protein